MNVLHATRMAAVTTGLFALLAGSPASAGTWTLTGNIDVHDPAIIKEGNTWWVAGTGVGLPIKYSADGKAWTQGVQRFPSELSWWRTHAPNMGANDVWAPDLHAYNGRVWMYYAVSEFGKNNSAIGLTSAPTVAGGAWRDDGLVLSSKSGSTAYNAIDPSLTFDASGNPYLVFGSWFSGIQVTAIDRSTMKPTGSITRIAARSGGIEAPNIVYANGYYYLFVSFDNCCKGVDSTYKIAYGRSTSITGPYTDRSGVAMTSSGGTVLESSHSPYIGPGGQSVVQNGNGWVIIRHYYDANANGTARMLISDLYFDSSGWPTYTAPSDTSAPSTPTGLAASNVTTSAITLSWTASTDNVGVTGYEVLSGATVALSTTATTATLSGLSPGVSYTLSVRAKDAAGNVSGPATAIRVTTLTPPDTTPPSQPAGLTVSNVTTSSVVLSWSASTDAVGVVGYDVYSGSELFGSTTGTSITLSYLSSATTYVFTVKARDLAGNRSAASAAVEVTTASDLDITPPTTPSNLIWANAGMTVVLSWSPSTDDRGWVGYQLFYGNFNLGTFTDTSLALIGFKAGTPYTFTVKAVDAAENVSAASNTVTVLLQAGVDTTPPTAPGNLTATSTTDKTVSLRWSASSDDVGVVVYQIYAGTSLAGTVPAATSGTVSGLTPATSYTFTVRAADAAGNVSAPSGGLAVTTKSSTPSDTTPPTVTLGTTASGPITAASSLGLGASATDDVGVVRVDFYDGSTLLGSVTTAPFGLNLSVTSASNGTHAFTAKAYDAAGNVGTSTAVSVTVNIGSGGAPVYTAAGGKLLKDGAKLELFGLNWFGMETTDHVLHGLWTGRQLADFLSDIQSKGFNALRLPLSPETINAGYAISAGPYSGDDCAAMCGKDGRTGLEYVLKKTQEMGISVLLDFHTCNPAAIGGSLPGTPINCSGYSLDKWLADLKTMASLSKTYTNVVGIDLTNEPWNLTWTQWASYASQGGQAVLGVNPNTTVWVEGIGNLSTAGVAGGANWGQNLYEAGAISGVPSDKLVYTPHSYGPSVAAMSYFTDAAFPSNMPAIWDTMFGHLISQGYTVVIGEFGGQYTTGSSSATNDKAWQDAFVSYLIDRGELSSFYWCVNPNSGDTGGVYGGDWKTWNTDKVELLQRLMK